jgi:hypothetical protein
VLFLAGSGLTDEERQSFDGQKNINGDLAENPADKIFRPPADTNPTEIGTINITSRLHLQNGRPFPPGKTTHIPLRGSQAPPRVQHLVATSSDLSKKLLPIIDHEYLITEGFRVWRALLR